MSLWCLGGKGVAMWRFVCQWNRASGENNNISTTQYKQFIERYYGRHKGRGKSKATVISDGRIILLDIIGVMLWGGGGWGSNLMSQWRYFGKNSLETPPKRAQMYPIKNLIELEFFSRWLLCIFNSWELECYVQQMIVSLAHPLL